MRVEAIRPKNFAARNESKAQMALNLRVEKAGETELVAVGRKLLFNKTLRWKRLP